MFAAGEAVLATPPRGAEQCTPWPAMEVACGGSLRSLQAAEPPGLQVTWGAGAGMQGTAPIAAGAIRGALEQAEGGSLSPSRAF